MATSPTTRSSVCRSRRHHGRGLHRRRPGDATHDIWAEGLRRRRQPHCRRGRRRQRSTRPHQRLRHQLRSGWPLRDCPVVTPYLQNLCGTGVLTFDAPKTHPRKRQESQKTYVYKMPAITPENVDTYMKNVVTEKDASWPCCPSSSRRTSRAGTSPTRSDQPIARRPHAPER